MDEKLEKHGLRYRWNGFPIYEDDEIIGYIHEPEWSWEDLTAAQQADLVEMSGFQSSFYDVEQGYALYATLCDYAIACTHRWVERDVAWRECKWCRVMEQLPGRVVSIGGNRVRVPDPPPPRWRVPHPATPSMFTASEQITSATFDVDEYEWDGHRYRQVR